MNDPAFKSAAYAIAEAAPRHLDQPTTPPIRWRLEGANLVVILADGRIASETIIDQKRDKPVPAAKSPVLAGKTEKVHEGYVFPKGYEPPAGTKPLPVHPVKRPAGHKKA